MAETVIQLPQLDQARRSEWWRAATGVAAVAAVFCLIVSAILVRQIVRDARENPLAADELTQLADKIAARPGDEQLREQFRLADLRVRQDFFQRRQFMKSGGWILLGGALVLAISLKLAFKLAERPPAPGPMDITRAQPARAASLARWAVGGIGLAAAGVLGVLTMAPGAPRLPRPQTERIAAQVEEPIPEEQFAKNWPMFRGYCGIGVAPAQEIPAAWDGASGKNILWKTPLPLSGNNSPIVWEDKVFCSGADGLKREVYCFDAKDGKPLWQRIVSTSDKPTPDEEIVSKGTGYAPSTMATDGRRVFAIFPTGDVACIDFAGKIVWSKKFDVSDNSYGHASSLLVWKDLLILQLDAGKTEKAGKSALVALKCASGEQAWKVSRPVMQSWTTPIIAKTAKGEQLITVGNPWIIAYDATGKELWRYGKTNGEVAPSAGFADGIVYFGVETCELLAIRADGSGDVSTSGLLWKTSPSYLPDTSSLLATSKHLFLVKDSNLECFDAKHEPKDGEALWEAELSPEIVKASPVLVGDRVCITDSTGAMFIFDPETMPAAVKIRAPFTGFLSLWTDRVADVVAKMQRGTIGEPVMATPAFVGGRIYVRGEKDLFCVGTK